MAAPPPGSVPVLKRRSENRVLEDVKKVALKHCDGLVKEFVDCTKVRVVRLSAVLRSFDGAPCCCSAQLRWLLILPSLGCALDWQRLSCHARLGGRPYSF